MRTCKHVYHVGAIKWGYDFIPYDIISYQTNNYWEKIYNRHPSISKRGHNWEDT